MSKDLVDAMVHMHEAEAMELAEKMLEAGKDPLQVLDLGREALEIVGKRFEAGKYFLPELIMSGEMLKKISKIAKPFIKEESNPKKATAGKVVIGSVKGDIHDIGKDMVTFMLDINGFEVHDLGVDVSPEYVAEQACQIQPDLVGLSGLLTSSYDSMRETILRLRDAGCRAPVIIGGGQLNEQVFHYIGADHWTTDAVAGVELCRQLVSWRSGS